MENNSKLNKTVIFFTFIFVVWMNVKSYVKEMFHMDSKLSNLFDTADSGNVTQLAFTLVLCLCSFGIVKWVNTLWNNLIPRITGWKEINYWETMGIIAFILLLTLL